MENLYVTFVFCPQEKLKPGIVESLPKRVAAIAALLGERSYFAGGEEVIIWPILLQILDSVSFCVPIQVLDIYGYEVSG